ncbi:MAG: hypothetical protein JXR56_02080 [Candidatus Cloacimonetes bacterium]|nr:hypothetical protein [Candidatus Cloacimonadota bacterium]
MKRTKGNIKLSRALRKKRTNEALQRSYDKLKDWTPSISSNKTYFRKIPRFLVTEKVSLPARALYIVLCCEDNYQSKKYIQVSQAILSKKSGLSIPTIINAVNELRGSVFLKAKKINEGQRRFWTYKPGYYKKKEIERDDCFFFFTYIVESGIWSQLSLRAKSLYLAMRIFSEFDFMLYCEVEGYEHNELNEEIKNIPFQYKWELCKISLAELCTTAGISYSNIHIPVKELIKFGLIDHVDEYGYIVYQLPKENE